MLSLDTYLRTIFQTEVFVWKDIARMDGRRQWLYVEEAMS